MDALIDAAVAASGAHTPAIVVVPSAVARHRPDLAVAHGRRAFEQAAGRAGCSVEVSAVELLRRDDAERAPAAVIDRLERADLIHLPGGDPDLIPTVLRDTPAWAAILRAVDRGACLAGASAGAMALAGRLWTRDGPIDGLDLLPGLVVLPHFAPDRLGAWRRVVDGAQPLTWVGIDEQTLVLGRPGEPWRIAGRGVVRLFLPGMVQPERLAGAGATIDLG